MKHAALISALVLMTASRPHAGQTANAAPGAAAVVPGLAAAPAHIPVGSRVGEAATGYDDGGRRDPFASLVAVKRTAAVKVAPGRPRAGLGALSLADIVVSGIVKSGTATIAILEGPNKPSYVSRVKDQLVDAVVVRIDSEGVVFAEDAGPGAAATRVRKNLRPAGEEVR